MSERIVCGRCGNEGPFIGHAGVTEKQQLAEAAGFFWVMVHSGPDPKYRWECGECREFDKKLRGEQ
jgi:ribosomal protein S27AE